MISRNIETSLERASWIREMFEKGARLKQELGADNVFDFSLGSPIFDPPQDVLNAFQNALSQQEKQKHAYMNNAGYEPTREHLATILSKEYQVDLLKQHIIMTTGAGGALNVIFKTLLDPEDEVIVISPYFVEYQFYIKNHQGKIVLVESDEDFHLNIENIENAITAKTKAVLINFPNNPTGVVYKTEHLTQLGELLKSYQSKDQLIYLVSDEPYRNMSYDEIALPNIFKSYQNSILASSFSKDLSLAGERIGYIALSPDAEYQSELFQGCVFSNRTLGFVNAPALMQRVITQMQRFDMLQNQYQELRDIFYNILIDAGIDVHKPNGGMFFFPKVPMDDIEFCKKALEHQLILVPGSGFGRKNHVRISFSVTKETIVQSQKQFKSLMQTL